MKLAPAYEGIELGIGDNILMKAVAESTGAMLCLTCHFLGSDRNVYF